MAEVTRIPVCAPVVGSEETEYVNDCLRTHWVSQGEYVKRLEAEFSAYIGCAQGVAVSNGTAALHLSAVALGLSPGDEVLISASTNMASAFSMNYTGAVPVPIDIELDTWQMDVRQIESRITPRTKAIEVVHLFGHPVDMDPVMEIAQVHNLLVIEDCAQAPGAEYKGRRVGSFGNVGCFSFYANKIITSGEGGMVTTNDMSLAEKVRHYASFCYGRERRFAHEAIGFNYRMPNLGAALALGQLSRIESILLRKSMIAERYRAGLAGVDGLEFPAQRAWAKPVVWMFNIAVRSPYRLTRDELMRELAARGIETREAFVPINQQRVFIEKGYVRPSDCPVANSIMEHGLYLPTGLGLTDAEIDRVCESIRELA